MQCRNCGTTIADKALICYKCGTATTDAKYQPVKLRRARRGPSPIVITTAVLLLILALVYYFTMR